MNHAYARTCSQGVRINNSIAVHINFRSVKSASIVSITPQNP